MLEGKKQQQRERSGDAGQPKTTAPTWIHAAGETITPARGFSLPSERGTLRPAPRPLIGPLLGGVPGSWTLVGRHLAQLKAQLALMQIHGALPPPYRCTAPPSPTAAAIHLLNLLKVANSMTPPPYLPYAPGTQTPTQGAYGPSSTQAEVDPRRRTGSRLGPGSGFGSSGAPPYSSSSAPPATSGRTLPSLTAPSVNYRPEQSRVRKDEALAESIDLQLSRAREEVRFRQREELLSSYPSSSSSSSSHPPGGPDAERSREGGSDDNNIPEPDRPETRCSTHSESASDVLSPFGLEKEDLERLISYPEDQITPSNLPFLLRQVRIQKSTRSTRSTTTGRSHFHAPSRPTRGESSFVFDYGHTGKYVGATQSGEVKVRASGSSQRSPLLPSSSSSLFDKETDRRGSTSLPPKHPSCTLFRGVYPHRPGLRLDGGTDARSRFEAGGQRSKGRPAQKRNYLHTPYPECNGQMILPRRSSSHGSSSEAPGEKRNRSPHASRYTHSTRSRSPPLYDHSRLRLRSSERPRRTEDGRSSSRRREDRRPSPWKRRGGRLWTGRFTEDTSCPVGINSFTTDLIREEGSSEKPLCEVEEEEPGEGEEPVYQIVDSVEDDQDQEESKSSECLKEEEPAVKEEEETSTTAAEKKNTLGNLDDDEDDEEVMKRKDAISEEQSSETSVCLNGAADEEEEEEEQRSKAAKSKCDDVRAVRKMKLIEPEVKRTRPSPRDPADLRLPPFRPNSPLGQEHVVPKSGFFCNLCRVFYLNENAAKETHCSSRKHYDNLRNYYQKLQHDPTTPHFSISG